MDGINRIAWFFILRIDVSFVITAAGCSGTFQPI
jgi:hypothetical protein